MAGHLVTGRYLAHLRDNLGAGVLGRGTAGAEPAAGGRVAQSWALRDTCFTAEDGEIVASYSEGVHDKAPWAPKH